jgi:predicted enzyme related to lactoylglutathione lyase
MNRKPIIRKIDCIRIYVPDLEAGLSFYRDKLGHHLIWRTDHALGLRLPETDAEIVLEDEYKVYEVDFKVDSVEEAVRRLTEAGAKIRVPPFDIPIGRCAVILDPWGNPFVLLDTSKGVYATDENGNVIGTVSP